MELSWRAPSQTVNFSLSMAPRAKPTKAQVVVWVLGGTDQQPHSPGKGGTSNSSRGRVAFTKSLGEVSGKTSFSLNFAEFAPQGNPGIITFTVGKTTPLEQSARAMAEQLKKDTLSIIGRSGTAEYLVQVTTADGAASTIASVNFGELNLDKSARPTIEYLVNRGTPEFPDQVWGSEGTIFSGNTSLTFRWQPPAGTGSAVYQIGNWTDVSAWPFWNTAKVVQSGLVKVSGTGQQQFTVDVTGLLKNSDGSKYWLRVVPIANSTSLSGQTTNSIALTLSKPAVETPKKAPLTFTTELVGWRPGYEGAPDDAYRFVVANPNWAANEELQKIIGGPVLLGAKVYLPPAPPPKEKAWYEKVFNAINGVLTTIKGVFDRFTMCLLDIVAMLPKLPFEISKSWGVPDSVADKAYNWASAPMHLADAPLNAANRIKSSPGYLADRMLDDMGVTDPKKRMAMKGNIVGGLQTWANQHQYAQSSPDQLGLALDPDFEKRTGVAYIKVTAKANGQLPTGFRAQGPSFTLEVGTVAQNTELLGIPAEYRPLYTGAGGAPTMTDGESIIIPVVMSYHWTHEQRHDDWWFGWQYGIKSRYTLNSKSFDGTSIHKTWGKVSE